MNKSEESIKKNIRKGSKEALEVLFRTHYNNLCNFALQFVKTPDEAEEIVQETFFRLWNRKSNLKFIKNLKSYLYTSVRNLCTEHGRHLQVMHKYASNVSENDTPPNPQLILEAIQLEDVFNKVLDNLPDRCRKIFLMSRNDGLKYVEIAQKLSISVKTVEADMGQTLKALRDVVKMNEI
jgi:RNA polymerase sigma-70 factor (ECF subfamily)